MSKEIKEPEGEDLREDKVDRVLSLVLKTLNREKLTERELLMLLSTLGYSIGASMEGFTDNGPSEKKLEQQYYESPTPGVGLMLQSLLLSTWINDIKPEEQSDDKRKNRSHRRRNRKA